MLEISDEQLKEGLQMAKLAACIRAPHCLWGEQDFFSKLSCCVVPAFGELIKYDSPCFFRKSFDFSEYNNQQSDLHDLHVYTQTFVLFAYPLFLANNREIPFLSADEIKEREDRFAQKSLSQITNETLLKMRFINCYWFDWIRFNYLNSFNQPKIYVKYLRAIALLAELFLTGAEGGQIPDISRASGQKKEKFFQELKAGLFSKNPREH